MRVPCQHTPARSLIAYFLHATVLLLLCNDLPPRMVPVLPTTSKAPLGKLETFRREKFLIAVRDEKITLALHTFSVDWRH